MGFDGLPGPDDVRTALGEVKHAHLMPTKGFERSLREACPNFFREYDQTGSSKLDRALKSLPNELKPDEEGFLAYLMMRRLFQAALIVASQAMQNCQDECGKTIDEQIQQLQERVDSWPSGPTER